MFVRFNVICLIINITQLYKVIFFSFIHLSTYLSIYCSIYPSIYCYIYLPIFCSIYLSIYCCLPIHPSMLLFIHKLSISVYLSIHLLLSTYSSMFLFIFFFLSFLPNYRYKSNLSILFNCSLFFNLFTNYHFTFLTC